MTVRQNTASSKKRDNAIIFQNLKTETHRDRIIVVGAKLYRATLRLPDPLNLGHDRREKKKAGIVCTSEDARTRPCIAVSSSKRSAHR